MIPNTNIDARASHRATRYDSKTSVKRGTLFFDERSVKNDCLRRRALGPLACRWATPFLETYTLSVAMPSQFRVSVSQCAVDVPHAPHRPQKMMLRRSHVSWLLCTSRFSCTHRFTCCTFDLSVSIGRCCPGSCTSLPLYISPPTPSKVFFITFKGTSVAQGVNFYASRFCGSQCLLSHKLFPSVVISGQHGGTRRGFTIAMCGGCWLYFTFAQR